MENSTIFIRGQIWYWKDPVYGSKEEGKQVELGDSLLRYNRYVLVVQTTDTISNGYVSVIPLSTKCRSDYDIMIPIRCNIYNDYFTYAKTRLIFPAHQGTLIKYVCTVPDTYMDQIEFKLSELLTPRMNKFSVNNYDTKFKTSIAHINDITNIKMVNRDSLDSVKEFVIKNVCVSYKSSVYISELKTSYDKFCDENAINAVNDIVEFYTYLLITLGIEDCIRNVDTYSTKINGYKLRSKNAEDTKDDKDVDNEDKKKGEKKYKKKESTNANKKSNNKTRQTWDDVKKKDFVMSYNLYGRYNTSDKFNLTAHTCYNYTCRWADLITSFVPPTIKIKDPVSKYSNMIRDMIKTYYPLEKLMDEFDFQKYTDISKDDFYNGISTAMYRSILDMLGINNHDKSDEKEVIMLTESSRNLKTWMTLQRLNYNPDFIEISDMDKMFNKYAISYIEYPIIEDGWEDKFIDIIYNKIGLHKKDATTLIGLIKSQLNSFKKDKRYIKN